MIQHVRHGRCILGVLKELREMGWMGWKDRVLADSSVSSLRTLAEKKSISRYRDENIQSISVKVTVGGT
jgi:hypothetical protein